MTDNYTDMTNEEVIDMIASLLDDMHGSPSDIAWYLGQAQEFLDLLSHRNAANNG
jgi:hypothetical protein